MIAISEAFAKYITICAHFEVSKCDVLGKQMHSTMLKRYVGQCVVYSDGEKAIWADDSDHTHLSSF